MSTTLHRITNDGPVRIELPDRVVVIVGGTPGSGKSTFIEKAVRPDSAIIISADACRGAVQKLAGIAEDAYDEGSIPTARKAFLRQLGEALTSDLPVVVDAAYLTRHSREEIYAWAMLAGYQVVVIFIEASLRDIFNGINSRARKVDPESLSKFVQDWYALSNQQRLDDAYPEFAVILGRAATENTTIMFEHYACRINYSQT